MAPWSSKSSTTNSNQDTTLSDLRTFANDALTTLTSNLSGLPGLHSSVENPKAASLLQDWQRQFRKDIANVNTGFPPLFESLLTSPERKPGKGSSAVTEDHRLTARLLLLQARNANTGNTNPDKILDLFQDHTESMLPVRGIVPIRASGTAGWLGIDWFRTSPYSPVLLEQHENCHQHGSMWRAAFEDLLATTLDKPAIARGVWEGSTEDEKLYKAWGAPGMDWMLGLQARGLLPPQLPSLYNISSAEKKKLDRVFGKVVIGKDLWTPYGKSVKADFERLAGVIASLELADLAVKAEGAETELDLYDNLYAGEDDEKDKAPKGRNVKKEAPKEKVQVEKGPTVVATLTTIETTVLPDGSTRKRRILKQRFADGREETKEEESTGRKGADDNSGSVGGGGAEGKDKGGWFWT